MSSQSFVPESHAIEAYYTNTEELLELFQSLVTAPILTKRILVIHGVGGVGKSLLLRIFRLHSKNAHVPVALVSGDDAKSAVEVLRDWAKDLTEDGIKLPTFNKTYDHYRIMLSKAEDQAGKVAGNLAKNAAKTITETTLSMIPVIGPILVKLGGISAEALIDWLRGQGFAKSDIDLILDSTKKLTDDFLADIAKVVSTRRIVLMLDTFEQMTTLNNWTCDLARRIHSNALIVIAGRAMVNWDEQWHGWLAQVEAHPLEPMTPDVMRMLVRRYYATMVGDEPDPKQVETIVAFARGLPMVVTSAVRLWVKYRQDFDFESVKAEVVGELVKRLREGVPPQMMPVLEAAATVRWFDTVILRAMTGLADVNADYDELRRFPFLKSSKQGLRLHDSVREILDESLRVDDRERHCELHERAAAYFETQMAKRAGDEAELYALERLYHRIRANEEAGVKLFQETAEELTRFLLVNDLRRLLNDVKNYELELENSRLWREYYEAQLAQIDLHLLEAEKVFESISESHTAEPKLRAYALANLGSLLRWRRIGTPEVLGKAIKCFKQSSEIAPLDSRLVLSLMELGPIYRDQGEWEKAQERLDAALKFYSEKTDQYGIATALRYIKNFNAYKGDWKQMFAMHQKGVEAALAVKEATYLKSDVLQVMAIAWIWAGRYSEAVTNIREGLVLAQKLLGLVRPSLYALRDLGYAMGFAGDFVEADRLLSESLQECVNQSAYSRRDEAVTLGFYGIVLVKQGELQKANEYLSRSLEMKLTLKDNSYIHDMFNYLGILCEIKQEPNQAENYFSQCLDLRWTGRLYFECSALTGLVRVKHAQGEYDAIPSLLAEAEQLAQQYEYNDHLASLRLTQAMTTDRIEWDGYNTQLDYLKQALIYTLRYNRFLLDEVLGGRPQSTPLRPIIPYCLERGEEGRNMLYALRDWWRMGKNDIGTPRLDTISPIPEGISLLEAERIARERELGDSSPQKTLIEQIEKMLEMRTRKHTTPLFTNFIKMDAFIVSLDDIAE